MRNYNAVQTVPDHNILVGRNRIRLDLNRPLSSGQVSISGELQNLYSQGLDSLQYRLREAYVNLYFNKSDLRIGRQIISWGRTDGAFITDVLSPVDLSEFLTQDFPDIRSGIDAISYIRYWGSDYLQLVVNPVFNPNITPEPGSRWFPRTFFGGNVPLQFNDFDPQPTIKNIQIGSRLALRSNLNYDLDLGLLYWHYPNPSYAKNFITNSQGEGILQLTESATQSIVLLYSGTVQLTRRLLFKSEASYYTNRSFDYLTDELRSINYSNPTPAEQARLAQIFNNNTDGFLKERPWLIGMAGLEYDLQGWTVGAQFIDEFIINHDEQILQEEHYAYATLLLQHSFLRNKLDFRGFGRYNISGQDFWLNPELTYSGIDNFEASLGTQLFGGAETDQFYGHLSFDNYSQNSFAYLQVTAYF
ncbi:hypothetical protein NC796_14445 [Aliifodinibius sp. S!AR15-10]|nr:hypothetical protein [Aliifodinibius sp. S!AR15-10]